MCRSSTFGSKGTGGTTPRLGEYDVTWSRRGRGTETGTVGAILKTHTEGDSLLPVLDTKKYKHGETERCTVNKDHLTSTRHL